MNDDLQTKHRAIGGPLDGAPIYTDFMPWRDAEVICDTEACEHAYRFDGRVWRHVGAIILPTARPQ